MTELEDLVGIPDPLDRARRVSDLLEQHQAAIAELARVRRDALEELLNGGTSQQHIAEALGMSRSRVSQLLSSGSAHPERAFFGTSTGRLTVAIGGKAETGRRDNLPAPVVSAEAMAAYELIADAARGMGLDAQCDLVPPPGLVDLNRDRLVVLSSPRLLPFVGQVLAADPVLGFGSDADGWYLVDRAAGVEHRSPQDITGEPCDLAYVGRLPRPSGQGSFLYLAGIHSLGTLGAARYVVDNLPELWRELKSRRFSVLVACRYDPDTRKITSTEPLTPLHRHEGS